MNIEQLSILKSTNKVMKKKLMKYEWHLKRKNIFSINMVLDLEMKLTYIQLLDVVFDLSYLSQGW